MRHFRKLGIGLWLFLTTLPGLTAAYTPYSTKELDELEKEFIQQINQADNVIRTPLASQYINHLGDILARNGQLPQPYFFLVKSNEINAFAGPGGYIGINSQLILTTENESELAAVMAHEMAHVRLHHLYRLIEHQKQMRIPMIASILASAALGIINPMLGSGALMASLTGIAQDSISYVRSNEKEADRIGIDMLIKSGLDPRGMAAFFKKMQLATRYFYSDNIPAILRTHPLDEDRIAEAENRSWRLAKKNHKDSLDYHLFKELIRTEVSGDPKQMMDYYQQSCQKHNTEAACLYGTVLTLLNSNQYQQAALRLTPLLAKYPDNLYFVIAMSRADIGEKHYANASKRLEELSKNYPDNYAALVVYAQSLIEANEPGKATHILLKASRQFRSDLIICEQLARAQATNHQKDYAYFTEAQCQLLQGRTRDAMRQLKLAKTLIKNDHLLKARIDAKVEEITEAGKE
ncbi:MAG: M48 family metalloprotease [Legionellales bacterium]|nr:M48 family metalloprotease [Legionellales bacterium]